jgi:purine-binding chemotaxis protein CheW
MSKPVKENNGGSQYLSFFIKDEMFAINVSEVREIIEYTQITRVPMMQKFIAGVTNIRGNVIPVLDLSERLGIGLSNISKKSCVITIDSNIDGDEAEVGIIVDMVDQVYEVTQAHKMDAPEFGAKIRKNFMHMMVKIDEKFMTILDMNGILNINELSRLHQN